MLISIKRNASKVIPKEALSFFNFLILLFFVTLHADRLSLTLEAIGNSFTIRINHLVGLFLLTFVLFGAKKQLFLLEKKILYGVGFLILALLCALFSSAYVARSATFVFWTLLTLLCYLFLPYLLMTRSCPKRVFKLYICSFFLVGAYGALQFILSLAGIEDPFVQQFVGESTAKAVACAYEPSYYALYLTPLVMMLNVQFLLKNQEGSSRVTTFSLIFINLCYLLSTTASAFICYLFLFGACLLFPSLRRQGVKCLIGFTLLTLLLFFLLPTLMKESFLKLFFQGAAHHSFYERFIGIKNAWLLFQSAPFFGVGLGAIPSHLYEAWMQGDKSFITLHQDRLIPYIPYPLKLFEPTNLTIEILASIGIVGFFTVTYLLWIYFALQWRAWRGNDLEVKNWALIFLISGACFLFALQFNQGMLRTYVWMYFSMTYLFTKCSQEKGKCLLNFQ